MKAPLIPILAASLTLSACAASGASPEVAAAQAMAEGAKAGAIAEPAASQPKKDDGTYMAPGEIVAAAPAADWVRIAPEDLLVMDLAADAKGRARRVIIQLIPAPFSAGWTGNIRQLAAAKWWDGTSINRVQDNYVVQWGDATEEKPLPDGLAATSEADYVAKSGEIGDMMLPRLNASFNVRVLPDVYAGYGFASFVGGWPLGRNSSGDIWPVHCYGMVGVGRNLSPDAGTGAELYTVIGHAPRHLDRNIALVGRIISGIEHLSSLPRGTGALGFYETAEERTPILEVRIATALESDKPPPAYEYLSTESASFAAYADARANRRDPFFVNPAGGADICNIPVPVRAVP